MFIYKIMIIVYLSVGTLINVQAADLNVTLISDDNKIYTVLSENLKKTEQKNDDILLQEALLEKLIQFSAKVLDENDTFEVPKDEKAARKLFSIWFDVMSEKSELEEQASSFLAKMATLKSQIEGVLNSDPSLLTYQLQYALYHKKKKSVQTQIDMLAKKEIQINALLQLLPKTLLLNQKSLVDLREQQLKDFALEQKKIKTLQVKKERLILLGSPQQLDKFTKEELKEKNIFDQLSKEIVTTNFLLFCDTLQKKDQTAFTWEKEIFAQKNDTVGNKALKNMLKDMEREYLGIINTIGGTTVQGVKYTVDSVWKLLMNPLFEINNTPVSIFKLIVVLIVLIIGFLIGGFFKHHIRKVRENSNENISSSKMIAANIGYYIILLIAFFSSLKVLGINLSSLAIVAGALSVGIGFGMQNIVSNFVSGLILMFERSIKIGDYVQIDATLRGTVTDIRMRSTTINTNQNIDVIIPNQNFVQNNVINWTMNDHVRRFEIPFGVKYGTRPQKVIDVILKAVHESGFKDVHNTNTRFTRVIMTEMDDSSVNFELFVWLKGKEILYPKRTLSRFLVLIYDTLYANEIEIPFPQRDLHLRSINGEIKFPLEVYQGTKDATK